MVSDRDLIVAVVTGDIRLPGFQNMVMCCLNDFVCECVPWLEILPRIDAIGESSVAVDVFDRVGLCQELWSRV